MKAEKLARSIFDQATEAVIVCNETGQITMASRAAHDLVGKNILLQNFDDILSLWMIREGAFQDKFSIATPLKGEFVQGVEVSFRKDDEEVFALLLSARPLLDQKKNIQGCLVTLVDITELKRVEEALKRSESLLKTVIEAIPDPIYAKDTLSRLVILNPAVLKIVGKPADLILGRNDREFYDDPAVSAAILENDRRVMATGVTQTFDEKVLTPEGYRHFVSTKLPWRDDEGHIIGIIGVSRDITELKQAEEETLRHMNELTAINDELARFNTAMVDRELRMIELKKEVNELCAKVGEKARYSLKYKR